MPEKDRNIYDLALMVQDASNIQGIIKSLHEQIVPAAKEDGEYDLPKHPAVKMFVHQVHFLAMSPEPEAPDFQSDVGQMTENLIGLLQESVIPEARKDPDHSVSSHPSVRNLVAKISYLAGPTGTQEWDFLHSICQSKSNFSHVEEPPAHV